MRIKDIADRVGVSTATVSRALKKPEKVSPDTREKVMRVVEELNFRPSRIAESLRRGQSNTIVVILPDITNPYFSALVRGVKKHAQACGYSVLLGDTQENENVERSYADMYFSRQADGLIICSQRLPFDIDESRPMADQLPPIVSTADIVDLECVHKVVVDNEAVGRDGIQFLLRLGHKNIGIIAGTDQHKSSNTRLVGVHQAFAEKGMTMPPENLAYTDFSTEAGVAAAKKLVSRNNKLSALFCFGDQLAIGAMHGLHKLGYKIPNDISILGIDDIAMASYTNPSLSTIAQPTELIGMRCMETLLELINKHKPKQLVNIIPHEIIVRESVKALD